MEELTPQGSEISPGVTQRFAKGAFRDIADGELHYRPAKVCWSASPTGDVRLIERVRHCDPGEKMFLTLGDEMRIFRRRKALGHSYFCYSY